MLRWLQSTVQISGGYSYSVFRLHVKPFCRFISFNRFSGSKYLLSEYPTGLRRVSTSSSANLIPKDLETLSGSLKHLSPGLIYTLYESVRARSQLAKLSPRQLSIFISVFGTSSLPPDAPRIAPDHLRSFFGTGTFWDQVLAVAEDKEKLGFRLNRADHYWVMWAWIERFRAEISIDFLVKASIHYQAIWKTTKFPDILMPYFRVLLSSGDEKCLRKAIADLCGLLGSHSNLHGRSLQLIWDVFLTFSEALNPSLKDDILRSFWNRSEMTFTAFRPSHYMATHMYNHLTKRHERLPLDVSQLIASLGAPLFPFFHLPLPISVQQWGLRQLRQVLSPSCSNDVRWANFSLFALYQTARNGRVQQPPTLDSVSEAHFSDWHLVLTLAILENMVVPENLDTSSSSVKEEICGVLDALWGKWELIVTSKSGSGSDSRPIFVSRAIVSAFLKLAARTRDEFVLQQCRRLSVDKRLWKLGSGTTATDRVQIEALIGDYVEASVRCQGNVWDELLDFLDRQVQGPGHGVASSAFTDSSAAGSSSISQSQSAPSPSAEVITRQLLARDVHLAHEFYEFCYYERGIHLETNTTALLAMALAPTRMHGVYPILERGLDRFDVTQLERILLALLNALRRERYPYLTPALARILSQSIVKYLSRPQRSHPKATRDPHSLPPMMKYPLRYPLTLLVASGRASDTVRIVELLNERAPSFLNERFLKRVLDSLLRHRQYALATHFYNVVKSKLDSSQEKRGRLRQKLVLGLIRGSASTLVKSVLRFSRPAMKLSSREKMLRRVTFRRALLTRESSIRVLSILRQNPADIPSIKHALSVLILSKRPVAAKRLFHDSLRYLDSQARTWFGNIFLHRILRRFGTRNIQVVKKLYRAKAYLKESFGFLEDRITLNVFVKALLRWKSVDSNGVRRIFDECVRMGYPVGERWKKVDGVPFGTTFQSHSRSSDFFTMSLFSFGSGASDISFSRHVRPLYKMFIKAFYTRKDNAAAKVVVGILKNEEVEELLRQQKRNRARAEGLRKVKDKMKVKMKVKTKARRVEVDSFNDKGESK